MIVTLKHDFGTKYKCFKCNCVFYDFKKPEPLCPKCTANQKDNPMANRSNQSHLAKFGIAPKSRAAAAAAAVPAEDGEEQRDDDMGEISYDSMFDEEGADDDFGAGDDDAGGDLLDE